MASNVHSAMQAVRTLIATCSTWRTITGTETTEAALEFVHLHRTDEAPAAPFFIIIPSNSLGTRVGEPNAHSHTGEVRGRVEVVKSNDDTMLEQYDAAWELMGALQDDMEALSGTGTHIMLNEIEFMAPREESRSEEATGEGYWQFEFRATWGPA